MDGAAVLAVIAGVVTIVSTSITVYSARKADRSASFTKTMEISVEKLVDQLQEERDNYHRSAVDCEGRYRELEASMRSLELKVEEMHRLATEKDRIISNQEAEIIRLRRENGSFS